MGVGATGEPGVSMRLGDDHADKQKQAKQFNKEIDQAKEAPDDDGPSAENAPQRKATGGWPTTGSLVTIPQFTDEQIYGETDAALKRIDTQIAEDREISKRPYEKRLQHARNRVSDGMDTWGTPKYNATKMTGDMVWNYGRNNTWKNDQGRELPFFTEGEKKAVYEDQKSKQQWAQQEQKEANERELTRVQIARDAQVKAGFDRIRSPAAVIQPFAFGAFGAPVFAAYAGIQTGKSVGDAYNACKNGPTTECLAATTHAGIAIATDVYALKSGAPGKGPQADASVSGEIINRKLPDGPPHAPAEPKVIVDRSAYMVEPGQAGMSKALGLDPSKTRVVANASDGQGADFQVVAGGATAATNSQKSLPPGVTYTQPKGTGTEPYGGITIKQSGDIHVTTSTRPGGHPSHQDLMNGQFGRLQIGERRFGIEGGKGSAMVTRTSGSTGFPTRNDLPSIQRALSEAGRLEGAIVHVVEGKTATTLKWTDEGWKSTK